MPENLQDGSKAEELEETISNLETVYESLDEITGSICTVQEEAQNVEFPGMIG